MSENTCAHQPCTCTVSDGDVFCSSACEEAVGMRAGDAVACGCDHEHCGGGRRPS